MGWEDDLKQRQVLLKGLNLYRNPHEDLIRQLRESESWRESIALKSATSDLAASVKSLQDSLIPLERDYLRPYRERLAEIEEMMRPINSTFSRLDEIAHPVNSALSHLDEIMRPISSALSHSSAALNSALDAKIRETLRTIDYSLAGAGLASKFETGEWTQRDLSFLEPALSALSQAKSLDREFTLLELLRDYADETSTDEENSESAERVKAVLAPVIEHASRNQATYLALLAILVSIILYQLQAAASAADSAETRKFQQQQLAKTEQMVELLQKLQPPSQTPTNLYVVVLDTPVKADRRDKSDTITKVSRNQEVRVEKIVKQWAYVEFFDNVDDVTRSGWMYKKYLKPVKFGR